MFRSHRLILLAVAVQAFAFLALLAACGSGGASSDDRPQLRVLTPAPMLTPIPTPTPTPSPTPPPPPPVLVVQADLAVQGGVFVVRLLNAPPGSDFAVRFNGQSYPMLSAGDRWSAVIGLPVGIPPASYPLAVESDGLPVASATVSVAASDFPTEYLELPPDSSALLLDSAAIEQENRLLASIYAGLTPGPLWSGPWLLPASGPISNSFGLQRSISGGPLSPHTGADIAAEEGSVVVAAASGRVVFSGELYLRGISVIIDHGAGVFSGYHHLSQSAVAQGQEITIGDLVGLVGATGLVAGPHLHWEAIVRGVRVNALLWTEAAVQP